MLYVCMYICLFVNAYVGVNARDYMFNIYQKKEKAKRTMEEKNIERNYSEKGKNLKLQERNKERIMRIPIKKKAATERKKERKN